MIEENKKIFASEAKLYSEAQYWRLEERMLAEQYFKDKDILVLGCGGGRTLRPLHKIARSIVAIDIVPEMVAASQRNVADLDIVIKEMDAAQMSFADQTFDAVFFPFHGIDYVAPDMYAAVKEVNRVLRGDGVFIFNSHNRYFFKKLHRFFAGKFDVYRGIKTYRTDFSDRRQLRSYFKRVLVRQRITFVPWARCNWKDRLYKLLPVFNKSTYFICIEPIR